MCFHAQTPPIPISIPIGLVSEGVSGLVGEGVFLHVATVMPGTVSNCQIVFSGYSSGRQYRPGTIPSGQLVCGHYVLKSKSLTT